MRGWRGQARLRDELRDVKERLRKEAASQQQSIEDGRPEPEKSEQDLELVVKIQRLQDQIEIERKQREEEHKEWEKERNDYEAKIEQLTLAASSITNQLASEKSVEESEETQIKSVLDAVERAYNELDHLVFLHNAWKTARESESDRGPHLYEAFCVLDRLAVEYRDSLGKSVDKWLHEQLPDFTFDYAPFVGGGVAGNKQKYTFGGIFMEKHLKFSGGYNKKNLLRVYFEYELDDDPPRCVIGHVGVHP